MFDLPVLGHVATKTRPAKLTKRLTLWRSSRCAPIKEKGKLIREYLDVQVLVPSSPIKYLSWYAG